MTRIHLRKLAYSVAILGVCAGYQAPAFAQATRTWVSGVGDDVNPCSRTAPCKTFAGAISKTAAGGEINCLDPAGYGAVTITKALVIDCHYTEGGALAGGNGIVVNAGATDAVTLRGLDIFGVNPPSNGVRIIAGGAVHIEECVIRRFNAANSFGVSFQPSANTSLFIKDSVISENGSGVTGGGILLQPTGAGSGRVVMSNVKVWNNANGGLNVNTSSTSGFVAFTVEKSEFAGNAGNGISGTSGGELVGMIDSSTVANNSGSGITSSGANTTLRVGNTTITGNAFASGAGVSVGGGAIRTYGDNRLDANFADGAFTVGTLPKK
jgi:hypothetical protein